MYRDTQRTVYMMQFKNMNSNLAQFGKKMGLASKAVQSAKLSTKQLVKSATKKVSGKK